MSVHQVLPNCSTSYLSCYRYWEVQNQTERKKNTWDICHLTWPNSPVIDGNALVELIILRELSKWHAIILKAEYNHERKWQFVMEGKHSWKHEIFTTPVAEHRMPFPITTIPCRADSLHRLWKKRLLLLFSTRKRTFFHAGERTSLCLCVQRPANAPGIPQMLCKYCMVCANSAEKSIIIWWGAAEKHLDVSGALVILRDMSRMHAVKNTAWSSHIMGTTITAYSELYAYICAFPFVFSMASQNCHKDSPNIQYLPRNSKKSQQVKILWIKWILNKLWSLKTGEIGNLFHD